MGQNLSGAILEMVLVVIIAIIFIIHGKKTNNKKQIYFCIFLVIATAIVLYLTHR